MKFPGFSVVVPASTANLGPGFDSVGLALNLYMTVDVSPSDIWEVTYIDEGFEGIANGADNLIVKTVNHVAALYNFKSPCLKLVIKSAIPLGKGLGSSAAAIAAGIEIANYIFEINLSANNKVKIGSQLEGHADNVSAALLGGVTINYFIDEEIEMIHIKEPTMAAVILVPPEALLTEASRGLLPDKLAHKEATRSSAAGNVMVAAMAMNDWRTVGKMMEKDGYHEPFRKSLFPDFDLIRKTCKEFGALGMTISGAGPSLFVAVDEGSEIEIAEKLQVEFDYYKCIAVQPSITGARII